MAEIVDTSSPEKGRSAEATTNLGNKYTYSQTEEEAQAAKDGAAATDNPESKNDFDIVVDWPMTYGTWRETTDEVKRVAAITRYQLNGSGSDYTLWFTNTEHYDYQFTNTGGENFGNNTFRNGDHYIGMDPDVKPPHITRIKGD